MDTHLKYTLAAAAAGFCGVAYIAYNYYHQRATLPASSAVTPPSSPAMNAMKKDGADVLSEEIFDEQMDRTRLFYGDAAFEKIKNSFVVVVGLGGVGSAAAHTLLRSGVRRLRLIDPDLVTLSSLNRNAVAQRKDVGRTKVQVLKEYFNKICPETQIETFETFFTEQLAPVLLDGNPDYVLDCIDNRATKVELMAYCKGHNLKIISSFGAASGHDPTKINVCDVKDSFGCVFGRTIRRYLHLRGIHDGILVVCSTEKERKKQIPLTEDEIKVAMEQGVKRKVRISKLGVAMPIPTIFGTVMANSVLSMFAGLPVIYSEEHRVPASQLTSQRLLKMFLKHEREKYHCSPLEIKNDVSINEVKLLMDTFGNVSAISGEISGTGRLIRWRKDKGPKLWNIIYVSKKEFDEHDKVENVEEAYPKDLVQKIDKILEKVKK